MRIIYKILKYTLYLILAVFLLVLAIFKIPVIRHQVLDYALESVNSGLQGTLYVDDIDLVNLSGIKLIHASLIAGCDTVAYVPEAYIKLNAFPMIDNVISVQSIELNYPVIKIIRSKDSTMNIEHIAYPSVDTTTDAGNTNLKILTDRIRIKNGRFELIDSLLLTDNRNQINYSDMIFDDLNMDVKASADLLNNTFKLSVDNLSGRERNSGLDLTKFTGDLNLSPDGISAENVTIKIDEQKVFCSVAMKDYNVFGDAILEKAIFDIKVKSENFQPIIANKFVEMPLDFKGVQDVQLKAHGTLNDFSIDEMKYTSSPESINLTGELKNLLNPEDFAFDLKVKNSTLTYQSISKKIIGIPWENIPNIGRANISYLNSKGNLDTISAQVSMQSDAGFLEGDLGVKLADRLSFSADIDFKKLKLARFINSNELKSDFTGRCDIKGSGSELQNMQLYVNLDAAKGQVADVKFEKIKLNMFTSGRGNFSIDTLNILFPNDSLSVDFEPGQKSKIDISGFVAFKSIDETQYDINVNIVKLNLAKMLSNTIMPSVLSCDMKLEGENFDINRIKAKIDANIYALLLSDKYLMPFDISLENSYDDNHRFLNLKSDFLDLELDGQFNYTNLIDALSDQSSYLSDFIQSKINTMLPDSAMNFTIADTTLYTKKAAFKDQNIALTARIKNTSIIRSIIEDIDLDMVANIDFAYIASGDVSNFKLNKCEIPYLRFSTEDTYLKTDSLMFVGGLTIALQDSLPQFSTIEFSLQNDESMFYNDLKIDSIFTLWNFDGQRFDYSAKAQVDNDFKVSLAGNIVLKDPGLDLTMSNLNFAYMNKFIWGNKDKIKIDFTGKGLNIEKFALQRDTFESVKLSGMVDRENIENLKIGLYNLNLHHILPFVPSESREYVEELYGNLDSLSLTVSGKIEDPEAKLDFNINDIVLNDNKVGYYYGNLAVKDNNLIGFTRLESNENGKIIKRLYADVFNFPINISQDSALYKSKINVMMRAEQIPLVLADPFIPNVSNIKGEADAFLEISGDDMSSISWKGYVDLLKSQLRLDATNLLYNATGKININKDTINLTKINLSNVSGEKYKGNAQAQGFVTLKDFEPDYLDITVKANKFQVMNNATVRSMPDLYGDFVITTDQRPIRFWGTLLEPNLEGDINVVYASLKMPDMSTGKLQYSRLNYKINDDETMTIAIDNAKLEMPDKMNQGFKASEDIAELMNYDLKIKILDKLSFQMDMGFLGQLSADVAIKDKNLPLIYKKYRNQQDAQLIGSLQLLESSVLNFAKMFNTYGEITFPSGDLQNPTLDLVAEYTGIIYEKPVQKNYTVKIFVTGTKELPKTRFVYTINGQEATGDPKKIEEDALYLLVFGRLKGAESTGGGASDVDNLKALLSGQASKYLTDILMKTGLVSNVDIEVNSDEFSESKMKFSGEMFGLNYQLGSTVGNMGDNQIIINIPFFKLFDSSILPNISGQVSISQSSGERNQLQERKKFEFKLRFGGSK